MKQDKEAVSYEAVSKNPQTVCGGCVHFQSPTGCSEVAGLISLRGWCELWAAARKRLTIKMKK